MFNKALGLDDPEPELPVASPAKESAVVNFEAPTPPGAALPHDKILQEVDEDLKTATRHALATGLQVLDRIFDYDPRQQGRMAEVAAQLINTGVGAASERRKSAQKDQEIQLKKIEIATKPGAGDALGGIGKVDNMQLNVFTGDRNALMKMIREANLLATQPEPETIKQPNGDEPDKSGTDE